MFGIIVNLVLKKCVGQQKKKTYAGNNRESLFNTDLFISKFDTND